MPEMKVEPVVAKAGGPYVCKAEPPKRYFGILVEPGAFVPVCPNCKKPTTPAKERSDG